MAKNPYDSLSKHWKDKQEKAKLEEVKWPDVNNEFQNISNADRLLIAEWACKTARTEELTGQQVMRLATLIDRDGTSDALLISGAEVMRQSAEEFKHALLYAKFAFSAAPDRDSYMALKGNFNHHQFTSIFRELDSLPVVFGGPNLVRFITGLFFLDLAGLMTVGVYEESPFPSLQSIAMEIRKDEGRHVQLSREYLLEVRDGKVETDGEVIDGVKLLRQSVQDLMPHMDNFFGNDDSNLQQTLKYYGIKGTSNAELKSKFRKKVNALLHL